MLGINMKNNLELVYRVEDHQRARGLDNRLCLLGYHSAAAEHLKELQKKLILRMYGMLAGPPPSVSIMRNHARALPRAREQVGKLPTDRSQQTVTGERGEHTLNLLASPEISDSASVVIVR